MSDRTLTCVDFETRLAAAKPGEKIIYHVGLLSKDSKAGVNRIAVRDTGAAAMRAWEADKVHLVSHRVVPHIYEYIAIVKGTPCGIASGA